MKKYMTGFRVITLVALASSTSAFAEVSGWECLGKSVDGETVRVREAMPYIGDDSSVAAFQQQLITISTGASEEELREIVFFLDTQIKSTRGGTRISAKNKRGTFTMAVRNVKIDEDTGVGEVGTASGKFVGLFGVEFKNIPCFR